MEFFFPPPHQNIWNTYKSPEGKKKKGNFLNLIPQGKSLLMWSIRLGIYTINIIELLKILSFAK